MTVRVLVVDDQALIRSGLTALLAAAPGFEPVGEAADGADAVALAAATRPDVVLMDIRMPVMDGIEATRLILARPTGQGGQDRQDRQDDETTPQVVVLTTFDLDEYVYAALSAGASGFLLKDTPPPRILAALQSVVAGDVLISPRITQRLVETHARRSPPLSRPVQALAGLTPRETEVLQLIGSGLSNSEIAGRLVLGESTVKTHVKRVMSKLGLSSRAQAVVVAYESGLIVPGVGGDVSLDG
ncbi:response regulator [Nocardioides pacificus]